MKTKQTIFTGNEFAKLIVLAISFMLALPYGYSQVAINTDNSLPDASAMLDVKATGLGLLVPRMTLANRPVTPATGLMIYQTDSDPGYYYYDGASWQKIGGGGDQFWMPNGSDIYFTGGGVSINNTDADGYALNVQKYSTTKSAVRGANQNGSNLYSEGQLGLFNYSYPGNPMSLPVDASNVGVYGFKPNNGLNGAAVYGWNKDDNTLNYGGVFVADGNSSNTNYAIYAKADSASANYAAYFDGRVKIVGNDDFDKTSDILVATVTHDSYDDTYAVYGISTPQEGYGIGIRGEGGWKGIYGTATNSGNFTSYGVHGYATGSGGVRVGVFGTANGGTTNWAGYFAGDVYVTSDLRIGTTTQATGYSLSVNGKIACEEVLVEDDGSWPDYVFDDNYNLMNLEELEQSINENNHLPGLPSAIEVKEDGFELAGMQKLVLQKVEELTLYTIEQGKMINILKEEIKSLKTENIKLNKMVHGK